MINTQHYQQMDAAHYLHPFTDSGALGANTRVITRAENVYVWDSENHRMLDGMSGLWCVNMGYGQESINQAITAQLEQLPYYNSFFNSAPSSTIELAKILSDIAPPGFNHVFFTNSGSEANDTVIRMIRRYWELCEQPQRKVIISRVNAYHGSTVAAASLGGMAGMHAQGGLPIPDIVHARQPHHFIEARDMPADEFGKLAAQAIADKITEVGADKVAAFIGEPIQGAGGVIVPPDTYWGEVQKLCDEYNIPIVADEVICGFGRLGKWFGCEHFNIRPKLMPIAKGLTSGYLPMGGVLMHDDIARVLIEKCGEFTHGFTYSGHPVCAAAAAANIILMQKQNIITKVQNDIAPYLQQQWRRLAEHPIVGEARGAGMMAAIELVADKKTSARFAQSAGIICRRHSIENGLIMRAVGDAMIIAPPLVITHEQIDELIEKAWQALDLTAKELRK